jgi:gliding motility-associated-like protein
MRIFLLSISVLFSIYTNAQLCTGSLGDPVVNITFGSGTNTGTGFTLPGYTYTSSSCPNDGFYTITGSASGCFGNTWHSVNGDHTGGGNFMLVNASFLPADFFVASVSGLCPNTTYEFSAWIMNVLVSASGIQPNISFSIETPSGVILNTYNTGDIPVASPAEWKQFGFYFTTTATNPDIVLRITNNAPGGIGNDLALDDITFRPCGPVLSSLIQGNGMNVDVCLDEQDDYVFNTSISPGFLSPVFQWQVSLDSGTTWNDIPGADNLIYRRTSSVAGKFFYRLTVAENGNADIASCRIVSNELVVNVHSSPEINAGPDIFLIKGRQSVLMATNSGGNIVNSWSPPDYLNNNTILNPVTSAPQDMFYTITGTSEFGCTSQDQVFVKVVDGIFVPNAFTPNNDGKNDSWTIPYLSPGLNARVNVYNRNGELIYQASGTIVNWDGTYKGIPQPTGTYVYWINFNDGSPDMKGTLNLIR